MAVYCITLEGERTEEVDADTYLQEGPMTTFFRTRGANAVVDSWSVRLASYRTASMLAVRRVEEAAQELATPLHGLRSA